MEKRWITSVLIAVSASMAACGDGGTSGDAESVPYCETTNCPKGTTCIEELRMCVSDSKEGNDETNPCDKCTADQECVENACVDKMPEQVENPCDKCTDEQECVENVCVDKTSEPPLKLCEDTDAPTCNGNAVVSCIDGQLVPEDCEDWICKDGQCVEPHVDVDPNKCDPADFEVSCDQNSIVSCVEGNLQKEECPEGQYCHSGACVDKDLCPDNADKMVPGVCGCALSDVDLDENGEADCLEVEDLCPDDPEKTNPGQCGCGIAEGACDAGDLCPEDDAKTVPGVCGCGVEDIDTDGDGIPDCLDKCPDNPYKFNADECSCEQVQVSIDETAYCATPIGTAQEFVDVINGIADESLEVSADSVYALVRNINLADVITAEDVWKPVTFVGKLTSAGNAPKTIAYTNADGERLSLHCDAEDESCGLFGKLSGARIHNINLNFAVSGVNKIGGLSGLADADTNITQILANTDVTAGGSDIGGVIGFGTRIKLSGITHQGKVFNIGQNTTEVPVANTGGIAGRLADASVISDSKNTGRVTSESLNIEISANYLGGIVGRADTNTSTFNLTNDSTVSSLTTTYVGGIGGFHSLISLTGNKNLVNNGYVKGYQRIGGIFGQVNNVAKAEGILDSVNNGTVIGLWQYTGGIVGLGYVPLKNVLNHGTVTGVTQVGGIAGQQSNVMDHVFNDGTVWSENAVQGCGTYLGGIVGNLGGGYKHTHLTNHGRIVADWAPRMAVNSTTGVQNADDCPNQNYGGIAGYISGNGTVMENVYNTGTLNTSATGLSRCGGIAGWAHSVALTNAKNTGNIKGGSLVGGIIGRFGMRGTSATKGIPFEMKNVENTGNILATGSVGGIIGTFDMDQEKAEFTFDQIVNRGNVSATSTGVGGIFGIIYTNNNKNVYKNIFNYGDIKGGNATGGIVGQFVGSMTSDWWEGENFGFFASGPRTMTNTFDSCVSTGNITSSGSYVGGLMGQVSVPAVAAYATTAGQTYKTVYCPGNGNIYHREIDFRHYNSNSIFNVQNSYSSGNITETGTGSWFGGLIGYIESRSQMTTFDNIVKDYDAECNRTERKTTSFTVTRLAQTNIKNSYALGTISSDHDYTSTLIGRLLSQDNVAATDEYKKQFVADGKIMSTISNLYSAVKIENKGSAVAGYQDTNAFLNSSNIYTWGGGNTNNLIWGNKTTLTGHSDFTFDNSGVAVIGTSKLLDTLNAAVAGLGLTAWKNASYTLPDNTVVTIPTFDLKPQLASWEPWEGK